MRSIYCRLEYARKLIEIVEDDELALQRDRFVNRSRYYFVIK